MNKTYTLLFCAVSLLLSGCANIPVATPYQPLKNSEGYISRKISENEYEIQVRGNSITTHPTLVNHFNRRATELCGSSNYRSKFSESRYSQFHDAVATRYYFIPNSTSDLPYVSGKVTCNSKR